MFDETQLAAEDLQMTEVKEGQPLEDDDEDVVEFVSFVLE
jgi:hypothetical protein